MFCLRRQQSCVVAFCMRAGGCGVGLLACPVLVSTLPVPLRCSSCGCAATTAFAACHRHLRCMPTFADSPSTSPPRRCSPWSTMWPPTSQEARQAHRCAPGPGCCAEALSSFSAHLCFHRSAQGASLSLSPPIACCSWLPLPTLLCPCSRWSALRGEERSRWAARRSGPRSEARDAWVPSMQLSSPGEQPQYNCLYVDRMATRPCK